MSYGKQIDESTKVKVGVFLLFGILLGVTGILTLGSKSSFFKKEYRLHAYFDDVSGMGIGSSVKVAGVNAGFVERVVFEERPSPVKKLQSDIQYDTGGNPIKQTGIKVRVDMKIDRKFERFIRSDSVASITTQGLLGDSLVYVSVGSRGEPLKDKSEILNIRNPSGFSQLQKKGEVVVKRTDEALKKANVMLAHVNEFLSEIKNGQGLVHQLIYDPESGRIIRKASKVVDNLDNATANVASIAAKIDRGEGTIGKFVNDPQIYNDLRTLLGKANRNKLMKAVVRYTLQSQETVK